MYGCSSLKPCLNYWCSKKRWNQSLQSSSADLLSVLCIRQKKFIRHPSLVPLLTIFFLSLWTVSAIKAHIPFFPFMHNSLHITLKLILVDKYIPRYLSPSLLFFHKTTAHMMRDYPFFWKLLVLSKFTVLIYRLKHIQLVLQSNKRFRDQCSTINSKKISVAWGSIWMPCFPLISFATLLVKNITGLDEHLCLTSFGHSEETIQSFLWYMQTKLLTPCTSVGIFIFVVQANTYNVELSCPGYFEEAMDRLEIRLLSHKRHYEELAEYQAPSLAPKK